MKRRILHIVMSIVLLLSFVMEAVPVRAAEKLTASPDCIAILKQMEGFSKYPVLDYGQYTVGYGTRCPDEDLARYRKNGITEKEAEELMLSQLEAMEESLRKFNAGNNLNLTQNQFDALLMFTYNLGTGWLSGTSDLKSGLLAGARGNELIYYMSRWCTADYQVVPGLVKRRLAEADLFLNGNYSATAPSYYSYVSYDPNEGACTSRVQGYDASEPPAVMATPTRTGYRFLGWYTAKEGGQWITDLDTTTAEKTLYARWQEGDGFVKGGVVQGMPCSYKRKVSSNEKLSIYEAPNHAKPFAQLDAGITVKIVADYVDSAGAKWGKMEGGGWVNLGTTQQIVTAAAKTVRENVTVTVTENGVNVRKDAGTGFAVVTKVNAGDRLVISETKMVGNVKWGRYSAGWLSLAYTDYGKTPDPTPDNGNTTNLTGTVVNCNTLRIRSGPGTRYSTVGSLANGQRVEISEMKSVGATVWGKIASGWICMTYVQMDKGTEVPSDSPEETPEQKPSEDTESGQQGVIYNCNNLNVRSGAGLNYKLVDTLSRGTRVEILETKRGDGMLWGRIKQGWVCMDYVQIQETENGEGKTGTVISTTALNIRAAASASSAWVGSLPSGSKVTIYETTKAGGLEWGRMNRGWVCMRYVRLDTDTDQPDAGNPTETEAEAVKGTVVNTDSLRVRSGPGTNHSMVSLLKRGDTVNILETITVAGVKWGRIDKGWISMHYVRLGDAPATKLATVRADSLRIRSGPGTDNPVVGTYSRGTQIEILETVMVAGSPWGRTKQGWISLSYVKQ